MKSDFCLMYLCEKWESSGNLTWPCVVWSLTEEGEPQSDIDSNQQLDVNLQPLMLYYNQHHKSEQNKKMNKTFDLQSNNLTFLFQLYSMIKSI
jgi:hypothetical protein